jgi:hypothetical protein
MTTCGHWPTHEADSIATLGFHGTAHVQSLEQPWPSSNSKQYSDYRGQRCMYTRSFLHIHHKQHYICVVTWRSAVHKVYLSKPQMSGHKCETLHFEVQAQAVLIFWRVRCVETVLGVTNHLPILANVAIRRVYDCHVHWYHNHAVAYPEQLLFIPAVYIHPRLYGHSVAEEALCVCVIVC